MANVSKFAFDEDKANLEKSEWLEAWKMTASMDKEQIIAWVAITPDSQHKTSVRAKLNHYRIEREKNDRKNAKRKKR